MSSFALGAALGDLRFDSKRSFCYVTAPIAYCP